MPWNWYAKRATSRPPAPAQCATKLMKQLGYGEKYKYAHDYPGNFVKQQFLPDELKDRRIWEPQLNPAEQKHKERMQQLWERKRNGKLSIKLKLKVRD